jgi:uncharacterized protein (TIGR00369 family)
MSRPEKNAAAPKPLSSADVDGIVQAIPFARFLGVHAELKGDELTLTLPFREPLIGNPMLPALHGGVIGAFMEITAVGAIAVRSRSVLTPKTIDITVEYLRSGRPTACYARAIIAKLGRRIANVRVECWQYERADPIALLHGHFLIAQELDPATA